MAKTNYRGYLRKPMVPLKKYFYVLRPLLSILWMEKEGTPAPIEFDKLRMLVETGSELDCAITELIKRKKLALEKEIAPAVPVINEFITSELERLENYSGSNLGKSFNYDSLNELFHKVISCS